MKNGEWFPQLEMVPGVGYRNPASLDRTKLPGHDAKPTVRTFSFEGKPSVSVMWATKDGNTSQSPAGAWLASQSPPPGAGAIRRLHEALALPGSLSDYHFAILGTCGSIWLQRREFPELLNELEYLCLLDIRLVESRPDFVRGSSEDQVFRIPTFDHLVRLYEREGAFEQALEIARRAAALSQGDSDVKRLEALLTDLRAEDAS
jgi:hypothetical protein